jgi:small subunit ribosomal protein S12
MQLRIVTPRKPNSARRPNVYVILSNDKYLISHIPGKGHNLKKHSESLIRGGGARDLPGVGYSCVRGKYGLSGVLHKLRRRSIYGVKRPSFQIKKLRRKIREIFKNIFFESRLCSNTIKFSCVVSKTRFFLAFNFWFSVLCVRNDARYSKSL